MILLRRVTSQARRQSLGWKFLFHSGKQVAIITLGYLWITSQAISTGTLFMAVCVSPQRDPNFQAALGWLQLGSPADASVALGKIPPHFLSEPDVTGLRWAIGVMAKHWAEALESADKLINVCPDRPIGWLAKAAILQEVSQHETAWQTLLDASRRFPTSSIVAFNLASLAGTMRRIRSARHWLNRAVRFGQRKSILQMALEDSNLRALWPEIRAMLYRRAKSRVQPALAS